MLLILVITDDESHDVIYSLYIKYQRRMLYTASHILGIERGEEAVHDVFAKLIDKFSGNYQTLGDKPGLYFVIMVRNHSLNIVRKEKMEFLPLEDELINGDIFNSVYSNPEELLLDGEAIDRLTSLIRQLTPTMRQIFEYRYIEGYSNIEIAKMLDTSQSAVSTAIHKAKKRLKELLECEVE